MGERASGARRVEEGYLGLVAARSERRKAEGVTSRVLARPDVAGEVRVDVLLGFDGDARADGR